MSEPTTAVEQIPGPSVTPTTDDVVTEKVTPPPPAEPVAPQRDLTEELRAGMAALARGQAELRRERERTRADHEAAAAYRALQEKAKTAPAEALAALGIAADAAAQDAARASDPLAPVLAKVEALEAKLTQAITPLVETQRKAAADQGMELVRQAIANAAEEYPWTHEMGEAAEVFRLMAMEHQAGRPIEFAEAASLVEKAVEARETGKDREDARKRVTERLAKRNAAGTGDTPPTQTETRATPMPSPTISARLHTEAPAGAGGKWNMDDYVAEVRRKAANGELR